MIKATFEKIGPIEKAELELGDLTIIAGQNNTGKTYLVYTLYGFLEFFRRVYLDLHHFTRRGKIHPDELNDKVKKLATQIEKKGNIRISDKEYKELHKIIIQKKSLDFSSDFLSEVFSSPKDEFEDAQFSFKVENEDVPIPNNIYIRGARRGGASLKSYFEDRELIFELYNSENIEFPSKSIIRGVYLSLIRTTQRYFPEPFILSAERFGISLFYKELDFTKNRLVEELQKLSDKKEFNPFVFLERESARYAQPIKDNIDFTRDLARIQKRKSELQTDKFHSIDRIMDGYYKLKNDEIRFMSKKRRAGRFDIPLHLASSSARGVSDLYFYLKHVAKEGQLLIIDEPESHLSPTNQILMARLLVFCVKSGLKVLITTHSDYMIKEINNLVMLNGNFEGKDRFLRMNKKDYTEDDCLNPKLVKAYICKDGTLHPCEVDERGIDMPVFDDAIDKINRISNDLYLLKKSDDPQDD